MLAQFSLSAAVRIGPPIDHPARSSAARIESETLSVCISRYLSSQNDGRSALDLTGASSVPVMRPNGLAMSCALFSRRAIALFGVLLPEVGGWSCLSRQFINLVWCVGERT
jgi:hypothetical protein